MFFFLSLQNKKSIGSKKHIKQFHSVKCKLCGAENLKSKSDLYKHVKSSCYKCQYCFVQYVNAENTLQRHIELFHNIESNYHFGKKLDMESLVKFIWPKD